MYDRIKYRGTKSTRCRDAMTGLVYSLLGCYKIDTLEKSRIVKSKLDWCLVIFFTTFMMMSLIRLACM